MKLYCVRHGVAEKLPDQSGDRPLTPEGRDEIGRVAAYLQRRHVHVAHVLHSNKLRAIQTAEVLAATTTNHQPTEECKWLGTDHPVAPLIELIQDWNDDTILVGHMPFMSQLVSALVLGDDSYTMMCFPPGTMACLERYENHRWVLNWILRPDLVPAEGD